MRRLTVAVATSLSGATYNRVAYEAIRQIMLDAKIVPTLVPIDLTRCNDRLMRFSKHLGSVEWVGPDISYVDAIIVTGEDWMSSQAVKLYESAVTQDVPTIFMGIGSRRLPEVIDRNLTILMERSPLAYCRDHRTRRLFQRIISLSPMVPPELFVPVQTPTRRATRLQNGHRLVVAWKSTTPGKSVTPPEITGRISELLRSFNVQQTLVKELILWCETLDDFESARYLMPEFSAHFEIDPISYLSFLETYPTAFIGIDHASTLLCHLMNVPTMIIKPKRRDAFCHADTLMDIMSGVTVRTIGDGKLAFNDVCEYLRSTRLDNESEVAATRQQYETIRSQLFTFFSELKV